MCAIVAAVLPLSAQGLDVDRQLEYCHGQIKKALAELKNADGGYDFNMQPRNILSTDKQQGWNCRKAIAEEWCSGFWPGILWMDYECTRDEAVRRAAEGYTESLRPRSTMTSVSLCSVPSAKATRPPEGLTTRRRYWLLPTR